MKIYHYHPVTKEYLGESIADESPLEKGVFLIPANATNKKPPSYAMALEVIRFTNGDWKIKNVESSEESVIIEKILSEEEKKIIRKKQILDTLEILDVQIPRVVEDIIEQGEFNTHENKKNIIAQKQALRDELLIL